MCLLRRSRCCDDDSLTSVRAHGQREIYPASTRVAYAFRDLGVRNEGAHQKTEATIAVRTLRFVSKGFRGATVLVVCTTSTAARLADATSPRPAARSTRTGDCSLAPGERQKRVPIASERPAVGTASTEPGREGKALLKRLAANAKTYRLFLEPIVCRWFAPTVALPTTFRIRSWILQLHGALQAPHFGLS